MPDPIARALACPPTWDGLATAPALTGLRRRSLAPGDLLAPSLAAAKPAATALLLPVLLTGYVGPGAWLSVVLALMTALLLRSVIGQFTSRMVTSGSLYTFVVTGLGPWAGLVAAVAMVVGYAFACGYALVSTGLSTRALVTQQVGASPTLDVVDVLVVLVVGVLCARLLTRRVSTFTAVTTVIQVFTLAGVGALLAMADLTGRVSDVVALSGADPVRIAGGAAVVLALLVGFECSASHAAESAQPFKAVPRAMTVSLLVTGGLCLVTTVALGGDPAVMKEALVGSVRIEHLWFPGDGAELVLFRVVRILSLVACTLAIWAATTRLVYTLALEGVLPRALARTHPRHATPHVAVAWTAPLVVGPGVLLLLGDRGLQAVVASLIDTTGLVMAVAYLLVCVAAPVFLHRIGELTARAVVASCTTGALLVGLVAASIAWRADRNDAPFVLVVALLVLPAGTAWFVVLCRFRRGALRDVGVHDATIAVDTCCVPGTR